MFQINIFHLRRFHASVRLSRANLIQLSLYDLPNTFFKITSYVLVNQSLPPAWWPKVLPLLYWWTATFLLTFKIAVSILEKGSIKFETLHCLIFKKPMVSYEPKKPAFQQENDKKGFLGTRVQDSDHRFYFLIDKTREMKNKNIASSLRWPQFYLTSNISSRCTTTPLVTLTNLYPIQLHLALTYPLFYYEKEIKSWRKCL